MKHAGFCSDPVERMTIHGNEVTGSNSVNVFLGIGLPCARMGTVQASDRILSVRSKDDYSLF